MSPTSFACLRIFQQQPLPAYMIAARISPALSSSLALAQHPQVLNECELRRQWVDSISHYFPALAMVRDTSAFRAYELQAKAAKALSGMFPHLLHTEELAAMSPTLTMAIELAAVQAAQPPRPCYVMPARRCGVCNHD